MVNIYTRALTPRCYLNIPFHSNHPLRFETSFFLLYPSPRTLASTRSPPTLLEPLPTTFSKPCPEPSSRTLHRSGRLAHTGLYTASAEFGIPKERVLIFGSAFVNVSCQASPFQSQRLMELQIILPPAHNHPIHSSGDTSAADRHWGAIYASAVSLMISPQTPTIRHAHCTAMYTPASKCSPSAQDVTHKQLPSPSTLLSPSSHVPCYYTRSPQDKRVFVTSPTHLQPVPQ